MSLNLAVKFYSQFPDAPESLQGIPSDWPCLTYELKNGLTLESLPDHESYAVMTVDDFNAYVEARQSSVDAWRMALVEQSS